MSDMKTDILNAAERRIQTGGYGGFSFREIAADVGIKSSSVHYHFPTKEDLAAAVIRRWAERTFSYTDAMIAKDPNPIRIWTKAFRHTAMSEAGMCAVTSLGAMSQDLPEIAAKEVKSFFKKCQARMVAQGLTPARAAELLSTIVGAVLLSNALRDPAEYDRATKDLLKKAA